MYCGSCLRDNALAAELIARGHDVTLLPLYTPLLTDEANVSRPDVLFGGISVYLQQHTKFFRKTPRFIDRFIDSPGLIRFFADRSVSTDPKMLGDLTISMLEGTNGVLRKEFDKLLDWVGSEPKPDLVSITNSMLIGLARPLGEALGRPVCCTLQGEDLFLDGLVEPYKSRALEMIRGHVRHVPRFIAVSEYYAAFMAGYLQLSPDKISVVPIGINTKDFDKRASRSDDIFRIGYLARVAPEKGLQLLADAYAIFRRRVGDAPVRLEAAGYMAPAHQKYLDEVKQSLAKAGIAGDFSYRGVVDRGAKVEFLRQIDVLSVPATYDEPKGFFLLEAMACGVPVVQPRRGSFTEIVEKTGGGLLVKPDDPQSLADGLHTLWRDNAQRQQLGRRGFDGVRAHYTIQRSTDRFLAVCNDLVRGA